MLTIDKIKDALINNEFRWSKHAIEKCDIYGYDENEVKQEIIDKGEVIEYHYWHGHGDKFIIFVNSEKNGIYHSVIINNEILDIIIIKTVYQPDDTFKDDKKTRIDGGRIL